MIPINATVLVALLCQSLDWKTGAASNIDELTVQLHGVMLRQSKDDVVALPPKPPAVANDPDRLARFGREARVLASLNHPNIAHIHGFKESATTHALVMELVDGDTLADRLARGPIPVAEAMHIARQAPLAFNHRQSRTLIPG